MRSDDRAVPTINPDRPAVEPWPAQLHIGIYRQPIATHVWDDYTSTWEHVPPYVWDEPAVSPYERFELWCYCHGLTITNGNPDSEGIFESGHVEMTLDNRDGALSLYDQQGRLVDWQLGGPLDIWATYGGHNFWLWSGTITAWREAGDGTIEVEAFDHLSTLNQFIGTWTPGSHGQTPNGRLTSIIGRVGFDGLRRFDTGDVTLFTKADDISTLEAMHAVTLSDGGVLYVDADGTLVYADRSWILGRDDQPAVPVLSDNVCDDYVDAVVWEAVQTTDDDTVVNTVTLENIDTPPVAVTAENAASVARYGPQTWPSSRTQDLWIAPADGQALAEYLVGNHGDPFLRLQEASLYLHDRRFTLWPIGLDLRIGDHVDWVHEQPTTAGVTLFALTFAVHTIVHEITPESWVVTLSTTSTLDHRDFVHWDRTQFRWDDPNPANVYVF